MDELFLLMSMKCEFIRALLCVMSVPFEWIFDVFVEIDVVFVAMSVVLVATFVSKWFLFRFNLIISIILDVR